MEEGGKRGGEGKGDIQSLRNLVTFDLGHSLGCDSLFP